MVTVHNLDQESVAKMIQLELASLDREPESPIGDFSFHGCTGGVAAFKADHLGSSTAKVTSSFSSWPASRYLRC
jgi:hypothetical protein